ncbi:uncharacterized protein LOC143509191 [Brachyhypopomus gauderio]|uniref:uncharacterized protein LOC143509191 n=1 Tax=Brachyhypopomus gauderio TaxID=698409 RepID=UPI00404346A0
MEGESMRFCSLTLTVIFLQEVSGASIRNEHVGKCVHASQSRAHVGLEECETGSGLQDWVWTSETRSLRNPQTDTCLTAVNIHGRDSVELQVCRPEEEGQAWVCSKKGHLMLHQGKGFHLSARPNSSEVFLSMERGKTSKWRTLNKKTVCEEKTDSGAQNLPVPRIITNIRLWHSPVNHGLEPTQSARVSLSVEPSLSLLNKEYGSVWTVTMLVLSCLALVLGIVILVLNIYQNRRKKTVVVLKSCSSTEPISQPGSPVLSERAPLTKHALRPPTSPSVQRGEILVEWKDGTVTPLFDTYLTS